MFLVQEMLKLEQEPAQHEKIVSARNDVAMQTWHQLSVWSQTNPKEQCFEA